MKDCHVDEMYWIKVIINVFVLCVHTEVLCAPPYNIKLPWRWLEEYAMDVKTGGVPKRIKF